MERNPDSYCGTQCFSAEAIPIQARLDVSVVDDANEFSSSDHRRRGAEKVETEITETVPETYYKRVNGSRAMITNLFKMFKFQTGKSKFIETYYDR